MAIEILKQPEDEVLNVFNNAVFEFTSDNLENSSLVNSKMGTVRATVKVDNVRMELSAIQNKFFVDLRTVLTMLFNQDNFGDQVDIPSGNTFAYRDKNLYTEKEVKFEIRLKNGTTESKTITLKLLKSVEQIVRPEINYKVQKKLKFLLPYTDQTAYAAFWEQYPFDVSVYSNEDRSVSIRDKRTSLHTTITLKKGVNRIFFSNGENDNGFQKKVPLLTNHVNELEFLIDDEIYATLMLGKLPYECGTYLKWFNPKGGWSYWKFNPVEIDTLRSKTNDTINRDFANIRNDTGNYSVISKELSHRRELKTGMLNADQQQLVKTILRSPKVFLLSNNPYQDLSLTDFKEIKLRDSSLKLNNKLKNKELKIEIDMPNQYVQDYAS